MGRVGLIGVKVSWLEEFVYRQIVLLGGTGSLLSGLQSSAGNEFGDVCGFCMALGSPSFNVQGCVTVFLEN